MEDAETSTTRKRTRGGRKHSKGVSPHDVSGTKIPRPTSAGDSSNQSGISPRGRGRPPGSCNKKFNKERSSTRQSNRSYSTPTGTLPPTSNGQARTPTTMGDDIGPMQALSSNSTSVVLYNARGGQQHENGGMPAPTNQHDPPTTSDAVVSAAPWATFEVEAISEVIGLKLSLIHI